MVKASAPERLSIMLPRKTHNGYYSPALAEEHCLEVSDTDTIEIMPAAPTEDKLAREIREIWNLPIGQPQKIPNRVDTDHILSELLVAQCMMETKDYKVFSSIEEYEELAKRQASLRKEVEKVRSKLHINHLIQRAYSRLPDCLESNELKDTIDVMIEKLRGLCAQQAENDYTLLQHTIGILRLEVHAIETRRVNSGELQLDSIRILLQSILNEETPNITVFQLLDQLELRLNKKQADNKEQYQQRAEKDLEHEYSELVSLRNTVSDIELQTNLIQSRVDWLQMRQDTLKSEIDTYRNEVFALRSQKQKETFCKLSMQKVFSEKEEHWIVASSELEANMEGVLKEVYRLTDLAQEFQADKTLYEERIEQLTQHAKRLESELMDQGVYEETLATAAMKEEFKAIITDIQFQHRLELESALEAKKRLENQIRDAKHERALLQYNRVNQGVQTVFRP